MVILPKEISSIPPKIILGLNYYLIFSFLPLFP